MSSSTMDSITEAVAAYNVKLTQVGGHSLIISVATMTGATLLVAIIFNILRGRNQNVYATRLHYNTDFAVPWSPPTEGKLPWYSWIRPVLTVKESVLLEVVGMDSTVFIRFMRMMLVGFFGVTLLCGGALLPINIVFNYRDVPADRRNSLSILTVADLTGLELWAHIVVSYLINIWFMYLLWVNQREVNRLRKTWFATLAVEDQIFARTLSIARIPEELGVTSDSKLSSLVDFMSLPQPSTSVKLGHDVGDLLELVEEHDDHVEKLEKCLCKYMRGGKLAAKRPMIRLGGWKWLPIGGVKVDAISYHTEEAERLEALIEERRKTLDTRAPTSYGFASFASVPSAHKNVAWIHDHHGELATVLKGAKVQLAASPKDIIWSNLEDREQTKDAKEILGAAMLFVVFLWWTLPVLVLSFLANLTTISSFIPFLQDWQQASNGTFSAVSGILPPLVAALFAFLLPIVIRAILEKVTGLTTKTELDRVLCARYFDFTLVSQLIVFSLISVIFNLCVGIVVQLGEGQSFVNIMNNLSELPGSISSTYLVEATYWTTWLPSRGFAAVFDLAQLINLFASKTKSLIGGRRRTPREIRESMKPKPFNFPIVSSNLLFMCTVGLAYACLAPVVACVCSIILALWTVVYKYQLMFVFQTKLESGGRLWPTIVNRVLVSLAFADVLVALTVSLARGWLHFLTIIPSLLALAGFKYLLHRRFCHDFLYYTPEEEQEVEGAAHAGDERKKRLEKRFEHPAMFQKLHTVMIASELAPLIPEVYQGNSKIARPTDDSKFSGTKLASALVHRRLKIAAVDESQLELSRDDRSSVSSTDSDSDSSDEEEQAAPESQPHGPKALAAKLANIKSTVSGGHLGRVRSKRRKDEEREVEESKEKEL